MASVRAINYSEITDDENSSLLAAQLKWRKQRHVVVEPLVFIVAMCWKGSIPITQYYLTQRFTSDNSFLSNGTHAHNLTENNTCSTNLSDPWYIATQDVQEKTSQWILYLNITTFALALLVVPLYGAFSDYAGRRLILVIPCVGLAIHLLIYTLVIFLNLEPWIMLTGAAVDGLCGSRRVISIASWAYLADTTSKDTRARRFVLLEMCSGLASGIAQIGLGYWTKAMGILPPSIFLTGCVVLSLIYAIFFVPEPPVIRKERTKICDYLTGMVRVFTRRGDANEKRHRGQLILLLVALFLYVSPGTNKTSLMTLFTADPPLCWGAVLISYSYGAMYSCESFGAVFGVIVFKRLGLTEAGIGVISLLSALPFYVMVAFSHKAWMIFVASGLVMFGNLIYAMIVTIISNACKADEQGSAMAGVMWIDTLCSLFGGILLNEIYQVTLFFMNGFVFLVCGGFIGLSLLVFIWATILIRLPSREPS